MALSLLSVALLATSAMAAPSVEVVQVREIAQRQDIGDLASLLPTDIDLSDILPTSIDLAAIASLIPSGCLPPQSLTPPTPPADVLSALATYSDYCHEPSFTGTVGEHYSSYESEASAWASKNEPALSSWLDSFTTACPYASLLPTEAADISSLLGSYSIPMSMASCGSTASSKETGSATPKPTGAAASGNGTKPADPKNSEFPGAASQQSALVAAAGLVAGLVGFVAVL